MTGNSNIYAGLRAVIAIAVLAAAFVLPAQALAQKSCADAGTDPTAAQYCSVSAVQTGSGPKSKNKTIPVASVTPNSGTPAATASSGSSLPFTGLDVGLLLLVALVLTGTGLVLWRLTAPGANRS